MKATWWLQKTPGSAYWRCELPAKHLPGQAIHLQYSDLKQTDTEVLVPRQVGAAIWQYSGNATRALIMAHQIDQGVRCLMEVDDNYLKPPPMRNPEWMTKLDRTPTDYYSFQAHRKIAEFVDAMIVSTDELANAYEGVAKDIFVCPNSIDLDDWEDVSYAEHGPLRVGYAGSDSHVYDLALIDRAMDAADRTNKVILYKFGCRQVKWRRPTQTDDWINDIPSYRKALQVLDVGVCPLKRGAWLDCKSDVKAMEYTMAGALPIVQGDSPVYADWVDVVPSASTVKQWEKTVLEVINLSPEERYAMWEKAHNFVLENRLIEQHIHKWEKAIEDP